MSGKANKMQVEPKFVPASSYTIDALAEIFTRSFEAYFYPGTATVAILAARARIESLDLHHSLVMRSGDAPVGIALLGLRGDRAWCGGFGVVLPFRGRGLAHQLAMAMIAQAREARARQLGLEVLTRNERALKAYKRAGFQQQRDLQILEWRRPEEQPEQRTQNLESLAVTIVEPAMMLAHFQALHPVPAAWQRDLPSLLVGGGMQGLALMEGNLPLAYALFHAHADGRWRIEDFGAVDIGPAGVLLNALQQRSAQLVSVNEPADSPLLAAFESAGFVEVDRQHELAIDLSE
jgi:RimJ/RimL family protein N-acetyltransferase